MLWFIIIDIYQMFIFLVDFVYVVESISLIKVYLLQLFNMFLVQLEVESRFSTPSSHHLVLMCSFIVMVSMVTKYRLYVTGGVNINTRRLLHF